MTHNFKEGALYNFRAYAKVNLYCDVWPITGGSSQSNYHKIDTWMHKIALFDDCFFAYLPLAANLNDGKRWYAYKKILEGKKFKEYYYSFSGIDFHCYLLNENKNDIISESVKGFFQWDNQLLLKTIKKFLANKSLNRLKAGDKFLIILNKNIPLEAGLGGGSTDAASLLHFLFLASFKYLFLPSPPHRQNNNPKLAENLFSLANSIGKDCVYCLQNNSYRMSNFGEEFFSLMPSLAKREIVLFKPEYGQATQNAFPCIDKVLEKNIKKTSYLLSDDLAGSHFENLENWQFILANLENSFSSAVPFLIDYKQKLIEHLNNVYPLWQNYFSLHLSGSGSCWYFLLKDYNLKRIVKSNQLKMIKEILNKSGWCYSTYFYESNNISASIVSKNKLKKIIKDI